MLQLSETELHVWPIVTDEAGIDAARFTAHLSPDEVERAYKYRFEPDRSSFLISRAALRLLLGGYLGRTATDISFVYAKNGKPRLSEDTYLRFNLSHTAGITLIAFLVDCEIGTDVEAVRKLTDVRDIATRFFCPEEYAELTSLDGEQLDSAFLRCWTRKEAYIKAIGEGLQASLASIRVSLLPTHPARLIQINGSTEEAARWTMHDIDVGASYMAAVAYRAEKRTVRLMDWINGAELLRKFA